MLLNGNTLKIDLMIDSNIVKLVKLKNISDKVIPVVIIDWGIIDNDKIIGEKTIDVRPNNIVTLPMNKARSLIDPMLKNSWELVC